MKHLKIYLPALTILLSSVAFGQSKEDIPPPPPPVQQEAPAREKVRIPLVPPVPPAPPPAPKLPIPPTPPPVPAKED